MTVRTINKILLRKTMQITFAAYFYNPSIYLTRTNQRHLRKQALIWNFKMINFQDDLKFINNIIV